MTKNIDGISVNLYSRNKLDEFTSHEKLNFIIKEKILVNIGIFFNYKCVKKSS